MSSFKQTLHGRAKMYFCMILLYFSLFMYCYWIILMHFCICLFKFEIYMKCVMIVLFMYQEVKCFYFFYLF